MLALIDQRGDLAEGRLPMPVLGRPWLRPAYTLPATRYFQERIRPMTRRCSGQGPGDKDQTTRRTQAAQ